jgi:hypothetical protein
MVLLLLQGTQQLVTTNEVVLPIRRVQSIPFVDFICRASFFLSTCKTLLQLHPPHCLVATQQSLLALCQGCNNVNKSCAACVY